jgi:hypothetical protein
VHGANDAAATAQVDIEAAFTWRDSMVANYSDAGQERSLAQPVSTCFAVAALLAFWRETR